MRIILFLMLIIPMPAHAEEDFDCTKASATLEILHCDSKEYSDLEKQRNSLEKKVIQSAQIFDKTLKEQKHEEIARNEQSAHESKNAFEEYRKAECARQEVEAGLGSIRRVIGMSCFIQFTKERIRLLEQSQFERQ